MTDDEARDIRDQLAAAHRHGYQDGLTAATRAATNGQGLAAHAALLWAATQTHPDTSAYLTRLAHNALRGGTP